ncbi:MAG: argininosuccinate lyase [Desulfurococcales archaeon]
MLYREPLLGRESLTWYISSMKDDEKISGEVLEVEIARVKNLLDKRLIPRDEGEKILKCLEDLRKNPEKLFEYKEAEDIFEAIEIYLYKILGPSAGWFSLGRSRNDHIAAVLRLKAKRYVLSIMKRIISLRKILVKKAIEYRSQLFPSYTHAREAQPITFGHYLLSIEEELEDHYRMFSEILLIIDLSPIGAGAIGGTTVEIDREEIARSLGFSRHSRNTLYMVSSRGFLLLAASIAVSLGAYLSRVANDLILFSSKPYSLVEIPSRHAATSSIMPHKVNPVTLEVLRARAGESIGLLTAMFDIYRSTINGYNLDFQEINRLVWRIFENLIDALEVLSDLIEGIKVRKERAEEISRDPELLTADIVEIVSTSRMIPHREAHKMVATIIREKKLENLLNEYLPSKNPIDILAKKDYRGSPHPKRVLELAEEKEKALLEEESRLSRLQL